MQGKVWEKKWMILGKTNNDGKAMKGGSNFLVNKLNFFH